MLCLHAFAFFRCLSLPKYHEIKTCTDLKLRLFFFIALHVFEWNAVWYRRSRKREKKRREFKQERNAFEENHMEIPLGFPLFLLSQEPHSAFKFNGPGTFEENVSSSHKNRDTAIEHKLLHFHRMNAAHVVGMSVWSWPENRDGHDTWHLPNISHPYTCLDPSIRQW